MSKAREVAALLQMVAGIGVESVVGLCTDEGADQVVLQLAVLMAGGAFVPLDTGGSLPVEILR